MNDNGGPLVLRGFDDVVAAVPHLLGVEPEASLVIFPTDPAAAAPMSRVDVPRSADERDMMINGLQPVYSKYETPVVVLAYTDRRDLAEAACGAIAESFFPQCPVVAAVTVSGDRWVRLDQPEHGRVSPAARDRFAAESIYLRGSTPYRSAREHRASFAARPDGLTAEMMASARVATAGVVKDGRQLDEERAWISLAVSRHVAASTALPDAEAARLLADIENIGLRDHAWAGIERADATQHAQFWKDLLTRAPESSEAPPASLAAFSYWVAGDGLSARTALERIPDDQDYTLAGLVGAALQAGVDPKSFPIPSELPPEARTSPQPPSGLEHERRQPPTSSPADRNPGVAR